jgi:hypothetical protein
MGGARQDPALMVETIAKITTYPLSIKPFRTQVTGLLGIHNNVAKFD